MENYLDYIDAYFQRMLDPEEIKRFEQKIAEDPGFADEVAFYVSAKQGLKAEAEQEKKEWFRQLLAQQQPVINIDRNRAKRIWLYRVSAAAAVIVCVFFAWYFLFSTSTPPERMAEKYIDDKFNTLNVTMGETDSIQEGVRLYNGGQLNASLKQFESIDQRGNASYHIKDYIGIIYLRSGNYDKALQYFKQFENDKLEANPSQFHQAITLLKRNLPGDKQRAKELLQHVKDNDLEGREFAEKWLDKW